MYIYPVNFNTAVSFISGYETALNHCDISTAFKIHISEKYQVNSSSDGWIGQLKRLSEKLNEDSFKTFKIIGSELTNNS